MCANHGVCALDRAGAPRCFCNDGFSGADCNSLYRPVADSSRHKGIVVAFVIVFTGLVLVVALLCVPLPLPTPRRQSAPPPLLGDPDLR